MPDTVICAPVRTAVGRYGGVFKGMSASALGAAVISAVVKRTGVDPGLIDDVIFGQCYPNGEAPALGRVAAPVVVVGHQHKAVAGVLQLGERPVVVVERRGDPDFEIQRLQSLMGAGDEGRVGGDRLWRHVLQVEDEA